MVIAVEVITKSPIQKCCRSHSDAGRHLYYYRVPSADSFSPFVDGQDKPPFPNAQSSSSSTLAPPSHPWEVGSIAAWSLSPAQPCMAMPRAKRTATTWQGLSADPSFTRCNGGKGEAYRSLVHSDTGRHGQLGCGSGIRRLACSHGHAGHVIHIHRRRSRGVDTRHDRGGGVHRGGLLHH